MFPVSCLLFLLFLSKMWQSLLFLGSWFFLCRKGTQRLAQIDLLVLGLEFLALASWLLALFFYFFFLFIFFMTKKRIKKVIAANKKKINPALLLSAAGWFSAKLPSLTKYPFWILLFFLWRLKRCGWTGKCNFWFLGWPSILNVSGFELFHF